MFGAKPNVARPFLKDIGLPVVRIFAAHALIGLLISCPFVCGAAEPDHGIAHRDRASDSSPERPHGPAHCAEGGDNCICEGAVQVGDVRVPASHDVGFPLVFAAVLSSSPHPIAHLTWDGSPTGLAGWGDHLSVRAFLQNYRC